MVRRILCVLLVALALGGTAASAQAPRLVRFEPPAVPAPRDRGPQAPADSTRHIPETNWQTGAIAGALVVGVVFAAAANGFCGMSDVRTSCAGPTIVAAVAGGALGFVVGGLIGGLFPKAP